MKKLVLRVVALVAVAAGLGIAATPAKAQFWSDGFESYSNGQLLNNVGGWAGWDNNAAAAGTATNAFAHTGNMSIIAGTVADAVHPFGATQFSSGTIMVDAWMLLNQADHTGTVYFIVNNDYAHGGPYDWTTQLNFTSAAGGVVTAAIGGGGTAPINYGSWTRISALYDLTANTQLIFYNGSLLSTGVVDSSAPINMRIANIDLYSEGGIAYYDDLSVIPEPATGSLIAMALCGMAMYRRKRA